MPEPETDASTNIVQPKQGAPPSRARPAPPPRADSREEEQQEEVATGKVSPRMADPGPPARTYSGAMMPPEQALDDFQHFVRNLPAGDKLAFVGAALTILSTFLPWKDTAADGEILGLMSLGIVVFIVMIAVLSSIVIRIKRGMPELHPLVPWLVQLGGTVFSALWCIIYIGLSIDSRKTQALVGNFEVSVSAPAFGVFFAIFCCALTGAGTLLGLKARST